MNTYVIYERNGTKYSTIFTGKLLPSTVEQRMLMEKHVPKRNILTIEYRPANNH